MNERQKEIIALFSALVPHESLVVSDIKGLHLFRVEQAFPRAPFSYHSELIILVQGEKRVYLGKEVFCYGPSHYLVLPVPLPTDCEGITEPGKPILGLSIAIDQVEIGELLLDLETGQEEPPSLPKGIYAAPITDALSDALLRLLQALATPLDKKVLAPMIRREILYRVLQGENGEVLRALAYNNRRFFQIARILQKIHVSYSSEFDIEELARELDMSSSTFHSSFKAVTAMSPLQYIKQVRLHKARSLMIHDGQNASIAAMSVGYESPSQFNREYKRLFGVTPARDVGIQRGKSTA
jgi:AraC-like DNA-binding protein